MESVYIVIVLIALVVGPPIGIVLWAIAHAADTIDD